MKRLGVFIGLIFLFATICNAQKFDEWWHRNYSAFDSKVKSDLSLTPEQKDKIAQIKQNAHDKAVKFGSATKQDAHKTKAKYDKLRMETDSKIQKVLDKRQQDIYNNMRKNERTE